VASGRASASSPGTSPELRQLLLVAVTTRATGLLRVEGEPGGVLHLADGLITAVSTPGAPGPETILLRSGRVAEARWAAAYAAAAHQGQLGAELVRQGLIGAGELEALLRLALADGMFAVLAGLVTNGRLEHDGAGEGCLLPLTPGLEPDWLLTEAARREAVLGALDEPVAHDRDRFVPGPSARPGPDGLAPPAAVLALANGRRTARDMAFVLGRGVYAVTLQLARMRTAGQLVLDSTRAPRPLLAPVADSDASEPGRPAARGPAGRRGRGSGPGGTARASGPSRAANPAGRAGAAEPGPVTPGKAQRPGTSEREPNPLPRRRRPGAAAGERPDARTRREPASPGNADQPSVLRILRPKGGPGDQAS
jgi:hypothetical protein